jgi:Dodecin
LEGRVSAVSGHADREMKLRRSARVRSGISCEYSAAGDLLNREEIMARASVGEGVYRIIDVIGTSESSWEDATKNAVEPPVSRFATFALRKFRNLTLRSKTEKSSPIAREFNCLSNTKADSSTNGVR